MLLREVIYITYKSATTSSNPLQNPPKKKKKQGRHVSLWPPECFGNWPPRAVDVVVPMSLAARHPTSHAAHFDADGDITSVSLWANVWNIYLH